MNANNFLNSLFIVFIIAFTVRCNNSKTFEQPDFYEKCRKMVLSENKVGQKYFFKIHKKEIDEFSLSYLGGIKTTNGDSLKFLNAVNYYGNYEDAKHANGFVFIYNVQNDKIGSYYVGGEMELPCKIEKDLLVFDYQNEFCNEKTTISFLDSIPKNVFIKCKNGKGDLYTFKKLQ